jgi:competence protein ComEA
MSKKELDHLYLTKNERMGLFILFTLLTLFIIIPWLYNMNSNNEIQYPEMELNASRKIENDISSSGSSEQKEYAEAFNANYKQEHTKALELFQFDPNHLSLAEAKKLGITEKSYHILQKYLATGAKIHSATQFSKIYGIDEPTFNRLQPYIIIKDVTVSEEKKKSAIKENAKKINLNSAGLDEFISLPGIGEKLATRIIKYRKLLGGFAKENQLSEVYGLQDSVISKIQPFVFVNGEFTKIPLNVITYDSLKLHPYFGPKYARIICEYRKQHSGFTGKSDLYKMEALDSAWINKVSDYLSFD